MSVAIGAVLAASRSRRRVVVLGQQLADARANEAARLAAGPVAPSPMPDGRYDVERGDYSFISVRAVPLDSKVQGVVRMFAAGSIDERRKMQLALSMDDLYTLLHFALRCAVLAVRERSTGWCEDGLIALAMIDETRIDPRDAGKPACLLGYAIAASGAERNALVERAAALARPDVAGLIRGIKSAVRLSDCLYSEVRTDDGGFGLIGSDLGRYEPTLDVTALALRIAAHLEHGRYVADPEIGAEVPSIWFATEHRRAAEELLTRARASIVVRGTLRKEYISDPSSQLFMEWVVEMRSEEEATLLCGYVGAGSPLDGRYSVGVASGRLFAILVAGSVVRGVTPFETLETLAPLATETKALLARVPGNDAR